MNDITVRIVPIGQRTDAVECDTCGPLTLTPHDEVDAFVADHLFTVHQCDPDTTRISDL